jgi:hypothetical protein
MAEVAPFIFMGLGALAIVRGVFRPHRAVLRRGSIDRCAGPNSFGACDPTDTITAPDGTAAYATASALVVAVGDNFVQLAVNNEPIFLMYQGVKPEVQEGQYVGRGQRIGKSSGPVNFGVWELIPNTSGPKMIQIPPAAWLAARGMRAVVKNTGSGDKWCEQHRKIDVPPATVKSCGFQQPDPASFALLPVQINLGG